ncbi:hypothetical protein GSI_00587 [Ganoderma sinense ZZ0214-1]|uniref:Uncharacterized protein n=1 Tax=Ganoderma sinense ZZ0214-1 TaxID=1077348 RepID=A0A2G8SSZ3_9APHY|nr:hypothetical protein GSI_00587 [Ganoderma sinense ZZ0214-1]
MSRIPHHPAWLTSFDQLRVQLLGDTGLPDVTSVSIDAIPTSADWGSGPLANTLCFEGRPVCISIVGVLRSSDMIRRNSGSTAFRLTADLVRDCDREGFWAMSGRYNPGIPTNIDVLHADRGVSSLFQVPRFLDGTFERIPENMPRRLWHDPAPCAPNSTGDITLSYDAPRQGDVVLIECVYRRAPRRRRRLWRGYFFFRRVTLVCRSPANAAN